FMVCVLHSFFVNVKAGNFFRLFSQKAAAVPLAAGRVQDFFPFYQLGCQTVSLIMLRRHFSPAFLRQESFSCIFSAHGFSSPTISIWSRSNCRACISLGISI